MITNPLRHRYKNILLFQALYGQRTHFPHDMCSDSALDAIFQYPAGVPYILRGKREAVTLNETGNRNLWTKEALSYCVFLLGWLHAR
jgi:hypothetical protein